MTLFDFKCSLYSSVPGASDLLVFLLLPAWVLYFAVFNIGTLRYFSDYPQMSQLSQWSVVFLLLYLMFCFCSRKRTGRWRQELRYCHDSLFQMVATTFFLYSEQYLVFAVSYFDKNRFENKEPLQDNVRIAYGYLLENYPAIGNAVDFVVQYMVDGTLFSFVYLTVVLLFVNFIVDLDSNYDMESELRAADAKFGDQITDKNDGNIAKVRQSKNEEIEDCDSASPKSSSKIPSTLRKRRVAKDSSIEDDVSSSDEVGDESAKEDLSGANEAEVNNSIIGSRLGAKYMKAIWIGHLTRIPLFTTTVMPTAHKNCYIYRMVPYSWRRKIQNSVSRGKGMEALYAAISKMSFLESVSLRFFSSEGKNMTGGGCNDLMYSGHFACIVSSLCLFYDVYKAKRAPIASLTTATIWVLAAFSALRMVVTNHHYASDCFCAGLVAFMEWKLLSLPSSYFFYPLSAKYVDAEMRSIERTPAAERTLSQRFRFARKRAWDWLVFDRIHTQKHFNHVIIGVLSVCCTIIYMYALN